jgi:WS/DGAT/MGAT family acyltransferase
MVAPSIDPAGAAAEEGRMAEWWYERLAPQDRSFLVFDGPHTPMHVGGVTLLEAAPLRTPGGGIDVARIRRHVGGRLHWLPRYRQRVVHLPLFRYPVWVDDDRFDLEYHVRHVSVPSPGTDAQLRDLVAGMMSQPLDPSRPLWEMSVIEGLEGDRFALFIKSHHCLVDGTSGVALLSILMALTPDAADEEAQAWHPRPAPPPAELLRGELRRQGSLPLAAAMHAGRLIRQTVDLPQQVAQAWSGLRETAAAAWQRPDETPLNRPVGAARRCDWVRVDLAHAKQIKSRLGGTVNDVIVATVAGALRGFLERRDVEVDGLHLRATVPVNRHSAAEQGPSGNHVSAWLLALPVGERDPLRRFAAVRELTEGMKRSSQALVIEALADAAAWFDPIHALALRLVAHLSPYNLIITNIVGPPVPLYLLGARMLAGYPLAPLFHNQGLAVGSFSYAGEIFWGCNADRALVPDLAHFTDALRHSFAELRAAAAGGGAQQRSRGVVRTLPRRSAPQPRRSTTRPARAARKRRSHSS